jgi:RNA polymerase sigma factor (sigma-70 family)
VKPPEPSGGFFYMKNPALELLIKCTHDDRRAHFELYSLCFSELLPICKRYFKNEDEIKSAVNESFLKLILSLENVVKQYHTLHFYSWMRKITINHIIDVYRKNKRYRDQIINIEDDELVLISDLDQKTNLLESKEVLQEVELAIGALPLMSRTVFTLHVIDGFKHEEIGAMLNISANTSKVHVFRARTQLKRILTELNTSQ